MVSEGPAFVFHSSRKLRFYSGSALYNGSMSADFVFIPKAEEIACEAGARLREFYAQGVTTEYKGAADLVTIADRTVEKLLRERLSEAFPEHGIYGEEGTRDRLESEFRWYVDPLDGTTNFAHAVPHFCVALGLEHRPGKLAEGEDGALVAAVLYDPMRDEMYVAERGKGAWLNGKRIHVTETATLEQSLVSTGFPSRKRHESPNIHFYHEFTMRSHGVRRLGSAALDLAYVAAGRYEAFWEFNLNPWDTAGGILLVEEAGGVVTDFTGGKYALASHEILATNGKIQAELLGLFADMFAGRELGPLVTPMEYAEDRDRGI